MGRTRDRLAKVLERDLGIRAEPDNLWPTVGYERTSRSLSNDTFRWSGRVTINGCPRIIDSYDTMTDCARYGVTMGDQHEIYARPRA